MTLDAPARTLDALFRPNSVAVIGATSSPSKAGYAMMRSLSTFDGDLYPVNPRGGVIGGRTAYESVEVIGRPVDLAVLVVPPQQVPDALAGCGRAGVRAAVVCAGGFAEAGDEGAALQATIADLARTYGIRLLGPNTSGFVNPADRVLANFMPAVTELTAGPAAIVAQSGGVNLALCFLAAAEGLGVRLGVGLGNAVDVGFADVLDHVARDDGARVVGLHIEGLGADTREVLSALGRLAARKPVVALKVGRADVAEFAQSHTGALTGSFALTRSALAQVGVVVVDDVTELVDGMRALAAGRLAARARPGVGVVTGQAGPGLIMADTLRASGVSLPTLTEVTLGRLADLLPPLTYQRNPVDTGRPGETFGDVVAAVAADPAVDGLVVYALDEPDALDPAAAVRRARAESGVPILFASGGPPGTLDARRVSLEAEGIPLYRSPDRVARAMRALVTDSVARWRLDNARARAEEDAPARAEEEVPARASVRAGLGRGPLDEDQAKRVLAAAGLAVPERRVCESRQAAERALADLGPPVVVKALDAALLHKSDVDGVHLNVRTGDDLAAALAALDRLATVLSRPVRYLVERQASPGVELIVGARRDAVFGPVVLLAPGGVAVELAADPILRLAPLRRADALEMAAALPARLLAGYRGSPRVDPDAVADALEVVARVLLEHEEIAELEVNPLRMTVAGALALDALIVLKKEGIHG